MSDKLTDKEIAEIEFILERLLRKGSGYSTSNLEICLELPQQTLLQSTEWDRSLLAVMRLVEVFPEILDVSLAGFTNQSIIEFCYDAGVRLGLFPVFSQSVETRA